MAFAGAVISFLFHSLINGIEYMHLRSYVLVRQRKNRWVYVYERILYGKYLLYNYCAVTRLRSSLDIAIHELQQEFYTLCTNRVLGIFATVSQLAEPETTCIGCYTDPN